MSQEFLRLAAGETLAAFFYGLPQYTYVRTYVY